jgi:virginiamycin B lyase
VRQTSQSVEPDRRLKDSQIASLRDRNTQGRGSGGPKKTPTWRRDVGFLLCILALCLATLFIFSSAGGAAATGESTGKSPAPVSGGTTVERPATTATAPSPGNAQVVAAKTKDYSLPQPNPGVMQPSVDQAGNIWFGEMSANALARLNPTTGAVASWTPPHGQNNIMATAIDRSGNVWFTEQAANYIGRFDPVTAQFAIYPLDRNAGPQDLKFDASGNLWFTEVIAGKIARLNPLTGAITTWSVVAPGPNAPSQPFCLAITPSGEIWFGDLSGGAVGSLNPATGAVHLHHLASSQTIVYAMNADANGIVWFTELEDEKLGRIDPATGNVSEIPVPTTSTGAPNGMYALQIAKNGDVWFASAGANSLVRYNPRAQGFTFYQLSIPSSVPFGLSFDSEGNLWFTADTTPNYVGVASVG